MAFKRKRASSPVFPKSQNHFRTEPNAYSISPSSSTSWSSISSATSSCVSEPRTPQDVSPLSNLKISARSRKAIFDTRGSVGMVPADDETMTIDSWRMEIDTNSSGGSDLNTKASSAGVESQDALNLETVVEAETEGNLSGRTRKRFRNSRPDATVVHENTLKKLFDAQRPTAEDHPMPTIHSQQQYQQPLQPQVHGQFVQQFNFEPCPPLSSSSSSSASSAQNLSISNINTPSSSSSTLDSFLGLCNNDDKTKKNNNNSYTITDFAINKRPLLQRLIPYTPHTSSFDSLITPSAVPLPCPSPHIATYHCEDCDATFPSPFQVQTTPSISTPTLRFNATGGGDTMMMMDVDSGMVDEDSLQQDFACRACGRLVCDYCACVMDLRRCLGCATGGAGTGS